MKISIKNPSVEGSLFWGWPVFFYFICAFSKFFDREIASPVFVVLGLFVLFFFFKKIQSGYFGLVLPLIGVVIIGSVGFGDYMQRDVLRDYSFALTPIALFAIGFWMASNNKNHQLFLKSIVVSGFFLASVHLIGVLQHLDLLTSMEGIYQLRDSVGSAGSFVFLIAVASFFLYGLSGSSFFPKFFPFGIVFPVLITSCIISFSRTGIVVALVCFLAFMGLLNKVRFKTILYLFISISSFIVIVITTPVDDSRSFRGKIANSIRETAVANYEDQIDINKNWRGFEANKAIETLLSGTIKQQILGHGFGAVADLGFEMQLGGGLYRYIPVLHNGYAYVLLKTGWLGLFLYAFFFFSLVRRTSSFCNLFHGESLFFSRMLLGATYGLILSMFVVGGMAEMADTVLVVLVGYLYKMLWQVKRQRLQHLQE